MSLEEREMNRRVLSAVAAAACIVSTNAWPQNYPAKPIRMLTPFAPGGGTDVLARYIGTRLTESFGQPIVVDNRPGAGGNIGAEMTARAEPDGYTLIIVSATYAATSAFRPPAFDPINDITPIVLLGTTGLLFTVHPSIGVSNIQGLIDYARANPGKISFATVGTGSNVHLALELFKLMTKTNMVAVPYKGGGPAMTAIVGGAIQATAMSMVPSMPHVKAGRVRALAVTTAKRSPFLPDVPAVSETVPGYEASHWYAMWGPKNLPKSIVMRWNGAVAKLLATPEAQARFKNEGLAIAAGPPEELQKLNRETIEKWRRVSGKRTSSPKSDRLRAAGRFLELA
jgi:tripartite-type tricarboxylate transporter receptor subunit TctC